LRIPGTETARNRQEIGSSERLAMQNL